MIKAGGGVNKNSRARSRFRPQEYRSEGRAHLLGLLPWRHLSGKFQSESARKTGILTGNRSWIDSLSIIRILEVSWKWARWWTVESDQVVIGYPKSASVARWRTDKPENRTLVAKICEEVAGRPITVRVIELNDAQTAGPTISQLRAKQKEKKDQVLIDEVKAHPLVKQALELFGGDVVSARRVPPKEETS